MIVRDNAKSWTSGGKAPSQMMAIEFDEQCCMCEKYIPNNARVLRHDKTRHILCVSCLVGIAELK
jgi:hypothetical protein